MAESFTYCARAAASNGFVQWSKNEDTPAPSVAGAVSLPPNGVEMSRPASQG